MRKQQPMDRVDCSALWGLQTDVGQEVEYRLCPHLELALFVGWGDGWLSVGKGFLKVLSLVVFFAVVCASAGAQS